MWPAARYGITQAAEISMRVVIGNGDFHDNLWPMTEMQIYAKCAI